MQLTDKLVLAIQDAFNQIPNRSFRLRDNTRMDTYGLASQLGCEIKKDLATRQPVEFIVLSESTAGLKYTVTLYPDGANTCTCPDFRHRRRQCKHIEEIVNDHT